MTTADPSVSLSSAPQKTILVLYHLRYIYPVVQSIMAHLYCWQQYSAHQVIYVNTAFGFPAELVEALDVDAIIFHTRFLSRWNVEKFQAVLAGVAALKTHPAFKVAMPQDEFINTDVLNTFINEFGINLVLSCAGPEDWPAIYPAVSRQRTDLQTTLTGYVDTNLQAQIEALPGFGTPIAQRPIDVGYRAWRAEPWLGHHGQHKVLVARQVLAHPAASTLALDISLEAGDTIRGMDWYRFMLDCKSTIGVEGGASVLDRDGSLRKLVAAYMGEHPEASYETVRDACFATRDGELGLACISPRHFEACMCQTAQLLVKGDYSGVLEPWRHYVPIEPDYSNLDEVLATLSEPARLQTMVESAYADVVQSGRYSYEQFVRQLDDRILQEGSPGNQAAKAGAMHQQAVEKLRRRDAQVWPVMAAEMQYHRNKRPLYKKLFYKSRFNYLLGKLSTV
ncbi:MAG: hypothetical protein KC476_10740 [Cyanobacteria bacterium HKST-UBA06]|nr:hypothetical protein [Cyanobacteria bacterium HKST-UBA06]